jgi:sortase A
MKLIQMDLNHEPERKSKLQRVLRWGEISFLIVGFACLTIFLGQRGYDWAYQDYESYRFERELGGERATVTGYVRDRLGMDPRESAIPKDTVPEPAPSVRVPLQPGDLVGRVTIPRLDVSAIVNEGVDKMTLARAVGHVPSTARPGEPGNIAIAAHRDTHFRPVRNLKVGDLIQMETKDAVYDYKVEKMWIVSPEDVSVLKPTKVAALTLITCYPFNFVGHAPKRYIIRATQIGATTHEGVALDDVRPKGKLRQKAAG